MSKKTIEIYVSLLEEGTPTIRSTMAEDLGNGLYKLLPTPNYNPEDEIWEFEPSSTVIGKKRKNNAGETLLVAVRPAVSADDLLKDHSGADIVDVYVATNQHGKTMLASTKAIDLNNGLLKLLPTSDYNVETDHWEFAPGSIVRTTVEKGITEEKRVAFDQIREDRMDGEYATYVRNLKQ